jgi:hypothetical protein
MNIPDRLFLNSIHSKVKTWIDSKFVVLFSYLGDIKSVLIRISGKSVDLKPVITAIDNIPQADSTQIIESVDKLDKLVAHLGNDLKTRADLTLGVLQEIDKSTQEISKIKIDIPKPDKVVIPSTFSLKETSELTKRLDKIGHEIENLQSITAGIKLTTPDYSLPINSKLEEVKNAIKGIKLISNTTFNEKSILKGLDELKKAIKSIPRSEVDFPDSISINNFPPQKVPQPVTNININPLRGLVHTSSTTVTSTLTTIPGYGVLDSRRSLIFQNLSNTVDIYIGGSNVTTGNGYLLEAGSISPSFDSGPRQIWYGITSSGSADIRTVELANDSGL